MRNRDETLEKKSQIMAQMVSKIDSSDALFFTNNNGLTVSQITDLRSILRENGASYTIIKNSLLSRVFSDKNITCPDGLLSGPIGVVVSTQDCPKTAAALVKFVKENKVVGIKGGVLEGDFISSENIKALAKLPSRDQLIGQFVGGLNSVIARFVQVLSSPTRGFVVSLDQIKNKKK